MVGMKRILLGLGIFILLGGAGVATWYYAFGGDAEEPTVAKEDAAGPGEFTFENPKKSAHYENNAPAHGQVLPGVPVAVVLNFNFDLATPSQIKIEDDNGRDYGIGGVSIISNKLGLRRAMDQSAPDGRYTVRYTACWPDRSCHDGHFQFAVDRNLAGSYQDYRGQKEVTILERGIKFAPEKIRVSVGTKVTWVNEDAEEHYVNSDPHPSHNLYVDQNSRGMRRGDTYSLTLSVPGVYPYHCSTHEATMKGVIIVE
jgi:plastocyanin/methionine-rich copper-binding protein CopC